MLPCHKNTLSISHLYVRLVLKPLLLLFLVMFLNGFSTDSLDGFDQNIGVLLHSVENCFAISFYILSKESSIFGFRRLTRDKQALPIYH